MSAAPGGILLSIVTPVLNGAATLRETLTSVAENVSCPYEHLIIDGGSSDRSLEIAQQYAAATQQSTQALSNSPTTQVKILKQTTRGLSAALNEAIEVASGQYIAILNSDDYYQPAIEEVLLRLAEPSSKTTVYYADTVQLDPVTERRVTRHATTAHLDKYMSLYHPALFVPRALHTELGGYDPNYRLAMDCEFVHRLVAADITFEHVNAVTCVMRLGGISHTNTAAAMAEYERSVVQHGMASRTMARWFRYRQTAVHAALKRTSIQSAWFFLRRFIGR